MNSTPIEKHLLELTKKTISDDTESKGRGKTIHATSITGKCVRKPYYGLTEEEVPIDYESSAVFKVGRMVHSGIQLSEEKNEYKMGGNIRNMTPIDSKRITIVNFFDCITGTADDILDINGELVIVDKKTISAVTKNSVDKFFNIPPNEKKPPVFLWMPKEASEDYVFQLNEYKLLYFIKHGIEIKKGAIIYLEMSTRFREPMVFEIDLLPIEEIRKQVIEKLDKLKLGVETKTPPDRYIDWHCRYCLFAKTVCHPEQVDNYAELVKR